MLLFVSQGLDAKPRLQVKVLDVVDGRSVKVQTKDEIQVVRLGGIGYPNGDERSIVDGLMLSLGFAEYLEAGVGFARI